MAYSASEGHLGWDGSRVQQDRVPVPGCDRPGCGSAAGHDRGEGSKVCSVFVFLLFFTNTTHHVFEGRSSNDSAPRRASIYFSYKNVYSIEKKYT